MKTRTVNATRWLASLIVTFLLGVGSTASAQTTNSWNVNAGGLWSASGNWSPASVPNASGSMAILANNITALCYITNNAAITLGQLQVGSADGVANFIITNVSGTLTFNNGGAGAQFISSGANISDRLWTPIVLADNLTVTNAKNVQISSDISETGGTRTLTKVGAGILTLTGTGSTFSGGLIIKGGEVNAASGGLSRAGTGMITLGDTTGANTAGLIGSATCTNAVTVVTGSTGVKTIRNSGTSAALGVSGPVTLNDNVTLNAGNSTTSVTISGAVGGTGAVLSTGSSTVGIFVALTRANTFSGGFTLQSGTLRVGNNSALGAGTVTINGGTLSSVDATAYTLANSSVVVGGNFILGEAATATGILTLSGNVDLGAATRTITVNNIGADVLSGVISSGTPGVGIIKAGTGSLSFNGANTYPGGVTINAGTLGCGNASALGTGPVTLGAISGSSAATLTSGNVAIANAITVAAGGTGLRTVRNNGTAATTLSGPILLNNNLTASTAAGGSATLSGEISGASLLTVSRDATVSANGVTLSHSNSFTGGVLLSAGTLRVGSDFALGTGTLTISDGTTFCSNGNTHRDPPNAVVVNGNFTVGQPGTIGAGSINFYGPMDLGSATRTITLSNTVSDIIYGVISGAGGLVKTGAVALYLNGTNTFGGGLTVKEGLVNFGNGGAVGTGSVTLGDATSGNSVTLQGTGAVTNPVVVVAGLGTRTLAAYTSGSTTIYSGGITLNSNLTVNCPNNNTTASLSGNIGGPGGVTVTATVPTSQVILAGTSTYAGDTTVSSGTLLVNNSTGSGTGTGNVTVQSGATLGGNGSIGGAVTVASGATLSVGAGVGKLTTGALTLNGNATNIWEISSTTGTAGVDWDLVDTGANNVNVQATSGSPFTFKLSPVGLSNFDKNSTYSWPAVAGNVLNFATDKFAVDSTGITNDLGGGYFFIASGSLNVAFTNNHTPVANAANYYFAKGVGIKNLVIPIASFLAANTTDADTDARALVSLTSSNSVVSTNANDINISVTHGGPESIAYVVKDVRNYRTGDTVQMATNYINIVRTNAVGVLTATNSGGTNMSLSFYAIPGYQYVIQRSPDLSAWTDINTNTASDHGLIQYAETPPYSPAFYRTRAE